MAYAPDGPCLPSPPGLRFSLTADGLKCFPLLGGDGEVLKSAAPRNSPGSARPVPTRSPSRLRGGKACDGSVG